MKKFIYIYVFLSILINIGWAQSKLSLLKKQGIWNGVSVEYAPDRILVKFQEGTTQEEIDNFATQFQLQKGKAQLIKGFYSFGTNGIEPVEKISEIQNINPQIIEDGEIEPDIVAYADATKGEMIPDDSLFTYQWHFQNESNDADIDMTEVWGEWFKPPQDNVIIIDIIDSGHPFTYTDSTGYIFHEDLPDTSIILLNRSVDFSTDSLTGPLAVQDNLGHGTFIEGELFAKTNNKTGVAGMFWRWGSIKAITDKVWNSGGWAYYSAVANAFAHGVDEGVNILHFSGGGNTYSFIVEEAVNYAFQKDVWISCSAGNVSSWGTNWPARHAQMGIFRSGYENIWAIGATDEFDYRASFSSYDPAVTAAAPGTHITSTTPFYYFTSEIYGWTRNYYDNGNGTSFSAPLATGMLAMMLVIKPNLTFEEGHMIIAKTSEKVGGYTYVENEYGYKKSLELGYGRINVQKALAFIEDSIDTSVNYYPNSIPSRFILFQNYPNPFNPVANIRYELSEKSNVKLEIYDILGKKIETLINNKKHNVGIYQVRWNGTNNASGIYFCVLKVDGFTKKIKMVLIK